MIDPNPGDAHTPDHVDDPQAFDSTAECLRVDASRISQAPTLPSVPTRHFRVLWWPGHESAPESATQSFESSRPHDTVGPTKLKTQVLFREAHGVPL
jgi:hypothetical protein